MVPEEHVRDVKCAIKSTIKEMFVKLGLYRGPRNSSEYWRNVHQQTAPNLSGFPQQQHQTYFTPTTTFSQQQNIPTTSFLQPQHHVMPVQQTYSNFLPHHTSSQLSTMQFPPDWTYSQTLPLHSSNVPPLAPLSVDQSDLPSTQTSLATPLASASGDTESINK